MAGHSKFKNIMHRKGAQDKKRGKLFTKLIREIIVAAKSGLPDVDANPRLRLAIASAKQANIPKDKIEGALKKATSTQEGENYEEIRYKGYGSGGVAIIVEALTDNKNRTATEIRTALKKHGGSLAETGSVSYMFDKVGLITFENDIIKKDEIFEAALENGTLDCISEEKEHHITCDPQGFFEVQEKLKEKFGEAKEAALIWQSKDTLELKGEAAQKMMTLLGILEDLDDVQSVYCNADFTGK